MSPWPPALLSRGHCNHFRLIRLRRLRYYYTISSLNHQ
nr:MAG TPA: hypothetical protein [Caudoviricetes sp.]